MGRKKAPFYRIVVADSRSPRDGKCIEEIGTYDPNCDPSAYKVDEEKAKKWLDEKGLACEVRNIKLENPTAEELRGWYQASALPLKRFFNTSGLQYKALGLKDKLPGMDEEAQLALLAADGMLVKRPILVGDGFVLTGFKPQEWEEKLG